MANTLSNIYLLSYNNYFNRTFKKLNTLQEYLDTEGCLINTLTNINFNSNDGVNTSLVINGWSLYSKQPDYILQSVPVQEGETPLFTRWFVIDTEKTSGSQYQINLRRDLIAEYYDDIFFNSTAYIEKGFISEDNNLIFNNEGLNLNQILQSKTPLTDETGCSWITLYMNRDNFGSIGEQTSTLTATTGNISMSYITVPNISEWEYYQYSRNAGMANIKLSYDVDNKIGFGATRIIDSSTYSVALFNENFGGNNSRNGFAYTGASTGSEWSQIANEIYRNSILHKSTRQLFPPDDDEEYFEEMEHDCNLFYNALTASDKNKMIGDFIDKASTTGITDSIFNAIYSQNEKIIIDNNNKKQYKIKCNISNTTNQYSDFPLRELPNANATFTRIRNSISSQLNLNFNENGVIGFKSKFKYLTLTLEEVSIPVATAVLKTNSFNSQTAPYKIIQIPFKTKNNTGINIKVDNDYLATDYATAFAIAQSIIQQSASTQALYDAQILPYFLERRYLYYDSTLNKYEIRIDTTETDFDKKVGFITTGSGQTLKNVGIFFYCSDSNANFNIKYNYNIEDYKLESQTDMHRLCSPGYNSYFEFNAAKNGGIDYFNVAMTAKPFSPYIRIAPKFGRLYGTNFDKDSRGLIVGGDFSLPQTKSEWLSYQSQNSTYLQQFNRQMENMEINNSIDKQKEQLNYTMGMINSGLQVAGNIGQLASGAQSFNAISGLVTSSANLIEKAVSGKKNMEWNEQLRNEAVDYTKDMFNYSLQNIKARPNTLTNVGSDTIDNMYFPFLEFYTCTETEKRALQNKIKYNGMTIQTLTDSLGNFINPDKTQQTYIKAQMIRINVSTDTHELNEIANEMNKGVYING